jgi:ribonuclease HII
MKDSKRFSSQKKIREVAEYIKENAVAWTVRYAEADVIDEINIRQAVLKTMRECCRDVIEKVQTQFGVDAEYIKNELCLLIDGNDFPPYTIYSPVTETLVEMESHTIEGGDNLYTCIAAASILAKVARDEYIANLCKEYPKLVDLYSIDKNKGYGTAAHMNGIKEHGITRWHRKSYGPCKNAELTF